ncbi:hypothetical protein Sfulv_49340 [Streptomyces fulvorobeus]|uniref:Uncharacterized protein n=1 Tax=Streptomyces fulvorobeus TaxID=284028 RepID=A0A7J0CE08_9ACTN|nr:hypothetical protein Sfulv_49340 [Streptomyces fulvorobeus]
MREVGDLRRSRSDQCAVRRFLSLVETYRTQHPSALPGRGGRTPCVPDDLRGGKRPRREPAADIIPRAGDHSAKAAPPRPQCLHGKGALCGLVRNRLARVTRSAGRTVPRGGVTLRTELPETRGSSLIPAVVVAYAVR